MKTRFKSVAALTAFAALAQTVSAVTAAETFKAHASEIATNRCVAVGGYVFGVGRAISRRGGDSVGFDKARLLAFGKIADMAKSRARWPDGASPELRAAAWRLASESGASAISLKGCETILEKCEAPEHYMAVIAVPERAFDAAIPARATLERWIATAEAELAASHAAAEETPSADVKSSATTSDETPEEYEPRGYWEENGVQANETMDESQFL